MNNLLKPEINADLAHWLNNKTAASNDQVVLLDGFRYTLQKLKHQGTVRITRNGDFHRRFWQSLDRTLKYDLYRKNKKNSVSLYQFYYRVLKEEGFIYQEGISAKLTEKGLQFLYLSQEKQLNILLNKIW